MYLSAFGIGVYLNIKIYYYDWCLSAYHNNICRGKSRVYYPWRESRPTATAPAPHSVDFYYYGFVAKPKPIFGL